MNRSTATIGINGRLSWLQMTEIEPGLMDLADEARSLGSDDWRGWERRIKSRLRWMAGHEAACPELASSAAYSTAYSVLLACWEGAN